MKQYAEDATKICIGSSMSSTPTAALGVVKELLSGKNDGKTYNSNIKISVKNAVIFMRQNSK